MTNSKRVGRLFGLATVAASAVAAVGSSAQPTPPAAPSAEKQRMVDLAIEHKTAAALYAHLKQEANGGLAAHLAQRSRLGRDLDSRGEPVLLGSRSRLADRIAHGEADA